MQTRPGTSTRRPAPRRRGVATGLALVAVLSAGTLACGGGDDSADDTADEIAEQLAESGSGVDDVEIDSDTGEVQIETEDGSFSTGTELPDDFPEDVPLPEGAEITATTSGSDGENDTWTVTGELSDATDSTFEDLLATFTDGGWELVSESTGDVDGGQSASASLDNGTLSIMISTQVGVEGSPDSFNYIIGPSTAG